MIKKLEKNNNIVFRFSKERVSKFFLVIFLLYKFLKKRFDIVHSHNKENWKELLIILFFKFFYGYKVILTFHSFREDLETYSYSKKIFFKFIFSKIDFFICVGENEKLKLLNYVKKEKIKVIPAYLNPMENTYDFETIPNKIWNFIESSEFLISANGAIRFYNNEDLYGLDMLIELIKRLEIRQKNIKLLFCVLSIESQNTEEKKYYEELKERIIELDLEGKIMLYEVKDTEFYPILKKTNLFVRPTNTDGDAISIREALYYNVPTVTSSVITRPKGTILFKSRDMNDLIKKINQVIDNYSKEKEKVKNIKVKDYFNELYKVYEDLSGRN